MIIKYESYKNELKYTLSSIRPQNGYDNTLIIKCKDKTMRFDVYLELAEEANNLFEVASFLKGLGKPLTLS